ncbi:MAG: amidohydrolase [Polyangiaceae bacterium]
MQTTVYLGAAIRTMDGARRIVDAMAIRGERVVDLGSETEVCARAGDDARLVRLEGRTILPGFIDAHHHVSLSALYGGAVRLVPPKVHDLASLLSALSTAAAELPPDRWLVAMEWDEGQLAERRAPTRQELDEAIPDRPVFAIHYTCHRAVANSRALELARIDRHTPDPPGGVIARDGAGWPNGLLTERGMSRVEALARPDLGAHDREGILARMAQHYRRLLAAGITRVCDATVPWELFAVYREAAARGHVLVPTTVCPVSTSGYLEQPRDVLDGPPTGHVEGPLTIGPVKLVFDGAPGCAMCLSWWQTVGVLARTAALAITSRSLDPVRTTLSTAPRYGAKVRTGIAIYRREEAIDIVRAITARGFAVATHAVGNEAAEHALAAYDRAGAALHAVAPPRLEHGSFLEPQQIRRLASAGIVVVVQPGMIAMPSLGSAASIPGLPFEPLRSLLDAGVQVAGSSDYPVTGFDVLHAIRAACSRRNARGRVLDSEQRIELDEALALYTRGAARACNAERDCGSLEVGKRADFVVVRGALLDPTAAIEATVVGGRAFDASACAGSA